MFVLPTPPREGLRCRISGGAFAAPVVFVLLCVVTAVTMALDRSPEGPPTSEVPGWQGWLLDVGVPIQRVVAAPFEAVGGLWGNYVALTDVRDENERLRARVRELEDENLQYREALVASGHLQRIAEMRDDFEVPMLPSEIVGLDVSPWFRTALVDRGRHHGVQPGNPVITDEGVVGLVTATSGRAARTMLLLDRQSAIDGIVERSRARGIVRGLGGGALEFEFVVRGSDVQVGDEVITSGMGGVYPKGLRIGVVEDVVDPEGRLLQTAALAPAVDFGRLEQVFVMLRRGEAMELLYDGAEPGVAGETEAAPQSAVGRTVIARSQAAAP